MTAQWHLATYADAVAGLRDRAAELGDVPIRIHERAIGDDGAPRLAPAFLRHLTASINDKRSVSRTVICPDRHETSRSCTRCNDLGSWVTTRDLYARPLSRALVRAAERSSKMRPHPVILVTALIAEGFDLTRAARRVGIIIASDDQRRTEEGRFLAAIRKVHEKYEEADLGPPGWLQRSDAQRAAEDAA